MKILLFIVCMFTASIGLEQNIKLPSFAELLASIPNSKEPNPIQSIQLKTNPILTKSVSSHQLKLKNQFADIKCPFLNFPINSIFHNFQ